MSIMSQPQQVPFQQLRAHCLNENKLYVDTEFTANGQSLYNHKQPKNATFEWTRAKDLASTSKFVIDNVKQFDVVHGKFGNPAITSALSVLCQYRGLFYRAIPADQGLDENHQYSGIFHFRFWWAAEWVEVIIDDQLPVVDGQLCFTSSQSNAQMWPALLEKAYAKLHGSYEALQYVTVGEMLSELSGGVTEQIQIKPSKTGVSNDNLLETIVRALESTILVTAVAAETNRAMAVGLLPGRAYAVTGIDKVKSNNGGMMITLIRFRQTPGGPVYKGPWASPTTDKWLTVDVKAPHLDAADAGAFWMTINEVETYFNNLELIHFDADTCHSEPKLKDAEPLYIRSAQGSWLKGATAGGCRNNLDTFHINPQYLLKIPDVSTSVLIALIQHRATRPDVCGFSVYKCDQNEHTASRQRFGATVFRHTKAVYHSTFTNQRQVVGRLVLPPGSYVLVPCTYEMGNEGAFTVKLYSHTAVSFGSIDNLPSVDKAPVVKAVTERSEYRNMFMSFADEKKTVNAYELQELLHACLPNDYMKSSASADVCRRIVQAFGRHGNVSRIDYNQFNDFIHSLKVWQEIFGHYSKTTSGVMKAEQLRDAVADVGFNLSTDILQMLMLRYMRRDGTLRFGDFVACILQLIAAFNIFNRKDTAQTGVIKLNNSEWMKSVLRC